MSNIFNDLNKLVNTVQKVDKLLTEKPKKKVPTKPLHLTNEERKYIDKILTRLAEYGTPNEMEFAKAILNKLG
jgi:hypothetical protein